MFDGHLYLIVELLPKQEALSADRNIFSFIDGHNGESIYLRSEKFGTAKFLLNIRSISSVGLERCLDRAEVTGSSPVWITLSPYNMTFGEQVIAFHDQLEPDWKLPKGIGLIYPFSNSEATRVFNHFFQKYFADANKRYFLFGINPGRFGAGVTGVPFTDPKVLQETCKITNAFDKRMELSSIFIYEMIVAMGGPDAFYKDFYITSICPLGFIKDGKNINYYDDPKLQKLVTKHILKNFETQLSFGYNRDVAFSIGQGKNFKFLEALNAKHKFFDKVVPLPHPRWVLQYRRKRKQEYLNEYVLKLSQVLGGVIS